MSVKGFSFPSISMEDMESVSCFINFGFQLLIKVVAVIDKCLKTLNAPSVKIYLTVKAGKIVNPYPILYNSNLISEWIFRRSAGPNLPNEKSKSIKPI